MDEPETRLTQQNLEHSDLHKVGYSYSKTCAQGQQQQNSKQCYQQMELRGNTDDTKQ